MRRAFKVPEVTYTPVPIMSLPLGCEERDRRQVDSLRLAWDNQEYSLRYWNKVLAEIEEDRTYERYPPEAPAGTLENLIKGIFGVTVDESKRAVEERTKAMAAKVKDMPELKAVGNPTGTNQYTPEEERKGNVCNNSSDIRGNKAEYRTRKLKRDHPEVFERMLVGEFENVAQAEEAAGTKKPSDRWNAPKDVEKLAVFLMERYTDTDILFMHSELERFLLKRDLM